VTDGATGDIVSLEKLHVNGASSRQQTIVYVSDQQLLSIVGEIVENTDLSGNEEDLLRTIDGDIENGHVLVVPETTFKCLEETKRDVAERLAVEHDARRTRTCELASVVASCSSNASSADRGKGGEIGNVTDI
jgi:hypothetical protein